MNIIEVIYENIKKEVVRIYEEPALSERLNYSRNKRTRRRYYVNYISITKSQ